MQRSRLLLAVALLGALPLSAVPMTQPAHEAELETLWVGPQKVDCVGVGPQECYLVKENQYEEWSLFYDEIEGFDWEPGYAWELLVSKHPISDPPADAPSIRLVLVEVVSKVEALTDPELRVSAPRSLTTLEATPTPAPSSRVEEAPSLPALRGHLTIGYGLETRSFKLCGAEKSVWIEDRSGRDLWATYRRLTGTPGRPLFVVVRGRLERAPDSGFGALYETQVVVTALRHAATESAGCAQDLSGFEFVASGSEPFWRVTIGPDGIAFSELGGEGDLLFPYAPPELTDGARLYRAETAGEDPHRIEIAVVEEPCAGIMVDAVYSHRSRVTLDGRQLSGCALAGGDGG